MPITHTNRKGVTYHLCRGRTSTGKVRYYFARQPAGDAVDEIPHRFTIKESVNGLVSLVKDRPTLLLADEVAAVEAAAMLHPRAQM